MNLSLNYNKKVFLLLISLLSFLRCYLSFYSPIYYYIDDIYDDVLLISYSNLHNHFLNWNILSLTKPMSYPLFLLIVNISHIPYSLWIAMLWIFAGIIVIFLINQYFCNNNFFLILVYGFIIFLPISFDMLSLRIYRNAIFAPMVIIFLTTLFIFIQKTVSLKKEKSHLLFWAIFLGLIFTFNFYIKEDNILTLPIFIFSLLAVLLFNFYEYKFVFSKNYNSKVLIKLCIIILIPLLIFGASTLLYKEINNYYFGIDEINTRTDGEIAEFYQNLLKIDDSNKTTLVWIPASTLEMAWNVSPTLQSRLDLKESLLASPWSSGNMWKNPMPADHMSWALRDSLNEVGLFNNEKQASDFFKLVNNEIDDAFDNGSLNKSNEIFISSSLNGKSIGEIIDIKQQFIIGLENCIFYNAIKSNHELYSGTSFDSSNEDVKITESILNQHLLTQTELDNNFNQKIYFTFANLDILIYQYFSYIIVLFSLISFIYLIIYQIKSKFENRFYNSLICFELMLLFTIFVQIFAVSWFCSWIDIATDGILYYSMSNHGIFALFEILAIFGFLKLFNESNDSKRWYH